MNKDIFDNLNKEQLNELLKTLKLYRNLTKKLWNRGKRLFKSIISWKSIYSVEYFIWASKDESLEEAIKIYKKVFWDDVSIDSINLLERESLQWWIKVFKDDNLVDLSFKKATEILK